eukprot:COSAG06_NODE_7783_length_2378_cov_1.742870_6_plen_76_part_00
MYVILEERHCCGAHTPGGQGLCGARPAPVGAAAGASPPPAGTAPSPRYPSRRVEDTAAAAVGDEGFLCHLQEHRT